MPRSKARSRWHDTKRRRDNCRRDSQYTRLGFGLDDNPRGSYLLSSRLSAAAPTSRVSEQAECPGGIASSQSAVIEAEDVV